MRQLDTPARHQAIRGLRELGTPESRETLLEIAHGKRGGEYQEWAATCYAKAFPAPEDLIPLLTAANPAVVAAGLLALEGAPLDDKLFGQLSGLLHSRSGHVRSCCLVVLKTAPDSRGATHVAEAIIQGIGTVETIENGDRVIGFAHAPWKEFTEVGLTYYQSVQALATAPTISLEDLEAAMPQEPGVERDCTLIARAWRGDDSVRPEVYAICRTAAQPNIRTAAVNAFSFIGTLEDIPLLEAVAAGDGFSVRLSDDERRRMRSRLPPDSVIPEVVYPNRRRALEVIRRIKAKKGSGPAMGNSWLLAPVWSR
ncbi:MAG: hypothetical protein H7A47_10510 [Verrucomicrobiales bacterium]|nr:hypothetical protein [Verrucomicrobiales bacterium]